MDFLSQASWLFEGDFREDAAKKKPKAADVTTETNSSGKKSKFNPSQQRGKDGRWVETGAENKNNSKNEKTSLPPNTEVKETKDNWGVERNYRHTDNKGNTLNVRINDELSVKDNSAVYSDVNVDVNDNKDFSDSPESKSLAQKFGQILQHDSKNRKEDYEYNITSDSTDMSKLYSKYGGFNSSSIGFHIATASQIQKAAKDNQNIADNSSPTPKEKSINLGDETFASPKKFEKAKVAFYQTNTLNDGDIGTTIVDGKKFFVKRNSNPDNYKYEELSSEVAKDMGLADLVVPVKNYKIGGKEYAVSPHLGEEADFKTKKKVITENKDLTSKAIVYDYIINQSDRHIGNIFVTKDKQIKLIDNESTFDNGGSRLGLNYEKYDDFSNDLLRLADKQPTIGELGSAKAYSSRTYSEEFKNREIPQDFVASVLSNKTKIQSTLAEYNPSQENRQIVETRLNRLKRLSETGAVTIGDLLQLD